MAAPTEIRPTVQPVTDRILKSEGEAGAASFVIFGASGDLTARKLLPALYDLWQDGYLSDASPIIGVARRDKTDAEFREEMHAAVNEEARTAPVSAENWDRFAARLFYRRLDIATPEQYAAWGEEIKTIERDAGVTDRRIAYLAVGPNLFHDCVEALAGGGLIPEDDQDDHPPWLRVVVEKPFGTDLESAKELNSDLRARLREKQLYRIDHYLGKETVQNVLMFRFGNGIFEPLFNRQHVDHVQITVSESQGIEGARGGYYDTAGALRDVLQNHVLQLLALVAMEPPAKFAADDIRDEKRKVMEALRPGGKKLNEWAIAGQYVAADGMNGYLEEDRIGENSTTETFAAMKVRVDNWRWSGVPFYLRTGKRLPEKLTEIAVQFKLPPMQLFRTVECSGDVCDLIGAQPNRLVFRVQPNEGIELSFSSKRPGMQYQIHPVRMDFDYSEAFPTKLPEAYERLLLDVMRGDRTLFTRDDELEAAWRFLDPVLKAWAKPEHKPEDYPAGTWGPDAAMNLLSDSGRQWRGEQ
ncbi:glucose-6-phosphate dehydrogenase [Alienimonas californiensis]|uniref:Glucose-6-phosphate 1-dehydrogenase n=1 Tax=Alienimonas californiensis TaxID=2527989 RepID=A0A517P411_9PLAN|nr:glucose-6-phosphate dehydrogenase [Alienimonas californiensis]QDT14109.1 Glucose-6-phosphate 1-dehydrogenase [Alienimonas californiensis]